MSLYYSFSYMVRRSVKRLHIQLYISIIIYAPLLYRVVLSVQISEPPMKKKFLTCKMKCTLCMFIIKYIQSVSFALAFELKVLITILYKNLRNFDCLSQIFQTVWCVRKTCLQLSKSFVYVMFYWYTRKFLRFLYITRAEGLHK